jgi:hypothetical protein
MRWVLPVVALAIPIQVWMDRGALFGVVAALTFPPMLLLGAFASEWLLRPRPPGPRIVAPAGPLLVVPLAFVAAGWLLDMSAPHALLVGIALYVPLAVLAVLRHPGSQRPRG